MERWLEITQRFVENLNFQQNIVGSKFQKKNILRTKKDLHLQRKIFHASCTTGMALLYQFIDPPTAQFLLSFFMVLSFLLDLLRFRWPPAQKFFFSMLGFTLRKHEEYSFSSGSYMLLGLVLPVYILPKDLAVSTILLLGYVDPVASYFGLRYGKTKLAWTNKSLEGSLAGLLIGWSVTFWYLYFHNSTPLPIPLFTFTFISALAAVLAEAFSPGKIDDNVTVPYAVTFVQYFLIPLSIHLS